MRTVESQRRRREIRRVERGAQMKQLTQAKKSGAWAPVASNYGSPRKAIKRCKVCTGSPWMIEPGRVDHNNLSVCLPGKAICRACGTHYAPEAPADTRAFLTSSAGMAAACGGW